MGCGSWWRVAGIEAESDRTWSYDGRVDHQLIEGLGEAGRNGAPVCWILPRFAI